MQVHTVTRLECLQNEPCPNISLSRILKGSLRDFQVDLLLYNFSPDNMLILPIYICLGGAESGCRHIDSATSEH